jgi:hypothetical protein
VNNFFSSYTNEGTVISRFKKLRYTIYEIKRNGAVLAPYRFWYLPGQDGQWYRNGMNYFDIMTPPVFRLKKSEVALEHL